MIFHACSRALFFIVAKGAVWMKPKQYVRILSLLFIGLFLLSACTASTSVPLSPSAAESTASESTDAGKETSSDISTAVSAPETTPAVTDTTDSAQTDDSRVPTASQTQPQPLPDTVVTVPSNPKTAEELLKTLTLEEKVAQMFIVRCPQRDAANTIAQYQFGGYILFARDFKNKTKAQATADIKSYQQAAKVPLLIAVDEEGGKVNRVSLYPSFRDAPFLSPQELYAAGGLPRIKEDTAEKCALLRSLGINLNLAPVCDVSTNPDDYIYSRTFGQDAPQTAEYIKTVVSTMRANKMGSALKHFPGYGNNVDTHTGIAIDNRPLAQFRHSDFLPFKSGINAGAGIVLVSHNIVTAIDADRPASLSSAAHRILRDELSFQGLIMTDDLSMGAIREYTGGEEAAVLAVLAGNDLICCTDYKTQYTAVLNAVRDGRISEARINESALRILRYKFSAGLMA